jgi:radical SAM superfamily enzyme YgiQ (UPF0313 family)
MQHGSRRVVLLSLDWLRSKDPRVSLGHASILARLGAEPALDTHPVRRAVNSERFCRGELLATLRSALQREETALAIGVYVWNEATVQWLLRHLRAGGYTGRIVLGGPQISYSGAEVHELYPQADAFVRGYAEDALAEVLLATQPRPIHGVSWRILPTQATPAPVDLESLPSPILTGVLPVQPFMRWETQRGCLFRCSFCQHREAGARLGQLTLSSTRVAAEIEALVRGGASDIAVPDPIFNANPEAAAILRRFRDLGYRGRLSLQSRLEQLDEDFLEACEGLDVRLEFGLQTVQKSEMDAVKRQNRLPRVERALARLNRTGLSYEISLIYGLPTQTLASFEDTIGWCRDRGVRKLLAFPLMLLRGTELDRRRDQWGLVESSGPIPVVVQSNSFSRSDWEQMRALAENLDARSTERRAA